ncbi:MAG: hypothetical protein ACI4XQ_07205 [Eubacteriales bacterium]
MPAPDASVGKSRKCNLIYLVFCAITPLKIKVKLYIWNGDAGFKEFQEYLSFLVYHTVEMIELAAGQRHDNGEFIYPAEDKIRLWKTAVSLLELLFPDETINTWHSLVKLLVASCALLI